MNRVLVTGLALGKETGVCESCNFDLDWLISYPSVLIWADKILVSSLIWEMVSSGKYPFAEEQPEFTKSVQLIFSMARSEGIVEIVQPAGVIPPDVKDSIFDQADKDRLLLAKHFSTHIRLGDEKQVPGQMFIDGHEYCLPYLYSVYAGLALARTFDAHCLFSNKAFSYCKYKFGLSSSPPHALRGRAEAFQNVFTAYVPNTSILPEYVVVRKTLCSKCAREESCRDTYLSQLETNVRNVLKWRDYDEIQQLKAVTDKIVDKRSKSGGIVDPEDVLHDLRSVESRLRRRMQLLFPRIQRWANITTMLSIPVALAGLSTGSPLLTISGGSLAGLSQATKQMVSLLSSKYSWIGFLSSETDLRKEESKMPKTAPKRRKRTS